MKLKDLREKVEALWDPLADATQLSECQIVILELAKETLDLIAACNEHADIDPKDGTVYYIEGRLSICSALEEINKKLATL